MTQGDGRRSDIFRFKRFAVSNTLSAQRIGTDGIIVGAASPLPSSSPCPTVWDVGAGTGVISLMIAQRLPGARIYAVELDTGAVGECRDNIKASPWPDMVSVVEGDVTVVSENLPEPDLIVSNPPFFSGGAVNPDARRALARQDGSLNPLSLVNIAAKHLAPGGTLVFIAPYDRNDEIQFHAELHRMAAVAILDIASRSDRSPIRRLWTMMRRDEATSGIPSWSRLDIRVAEPSCGYSSGYRELTSAFYLDF